MLRKILLSSTLTLSLFASVNLNTHMQNNKILDKNQTIAFISKIFPDKSKELISQYKKGLMNITIQDKGKFYGIKFSSLGQDVTLFVTKDKHYLIVGQIVDLKNKIPLRVTNPVNKEVVEKGVVFTFGNGKKILYLVTDPECPYCKKMHNNKKLMKKLSQNYKVKVILYPLPFHPHSVKMSLYVLQGKTDEERRKRLNEIFEGSKKWQDMNLSKEEKERLMKELQNSKKSAKELQFTGTPQFFNDKFQMINPDNL